MPQWEDDHAAEFRFRLAMPYPLNGVSNTYNFTKNGPQIASV
ncbi:MAG: hypothetical protein ABI886_05720 [Betaproteobacteria bacterium]